MNNLRFEELGLSADILKAISEIGFTQATPVQAQTIPSILQGHDVTGLAMTGTGKTAAFGLPLIDKIDNRSCEIQALVVCPTRELAIQITKELNRFLKYKRSISVLAVYGGQPIDTQLKALDRCPQIIVGTPGRLLDHIDRGTINLDSIKMVVLDEADEMLNMGFRNDIESILKSSPKQRQTVTFSATMPKEILDLIGKYQKSPKIVKIGAETSPASTVEQRYFEVRSEEKLRLLVNLLNKHNPYSSIVFCNTKHRVDHITRKLRNFGYYAEGLHGDISQPKRNRVMDGFRSGKIQILVATDVASRGIDIPNLDMIFNFEIPMDERSFVHRIGRTGRAGKTGIAYSLVGERDFNSFRQIKRHTKSNFIQEQLPTLGSEITENITRPSQQSAQNPAQNKIVTRLKQVLQKNSFQDHIQTVESLVSTENPPVMIAAALIEMLSQKGEGRPQGGAYKNQDKFSRSNRQRYK